MAIVYDDELIKQICDLYDSGFTARDITLKLGTTIYTTCKHLREHGRYKRKLKDLRCGSNDDSQIWADNDIDILVRNQLESTTTVRFLLHNKFSNDAIAKKYRELNIIRRRKWTESEIELLKDNYSVMPFDDVMKLLPYRTRDSILTKAKALKLVQYTRKSQVYTNEEKDYIRRYSYCLTDAEIAKAIGKTCVGVQEQRHKMGLYYINRDYSGYVNLIKLFRGKTCMWKSESMKVCNYRCVLTGSDDFEIHHIYSFNLILNETLKRLDDENILHGDKVSDYSKDELDYMISVFIQIHNKYPLGICVRRDVHKLFHQLYGLGGNTESQWNRFVNDFKNGKYQDLINV